MRVSDGQMLTIADAGRLVTLDYGGALAAHKGNSRFGVAVSFRMLQAAGDALSVDQPWDRRDLVVVSGHPGDGVRDTVEFVTHCVSRGRYRVNSGGTRCGRGMRFDWEVADGVFNAVLRLRDGFVPEELYALLDRRGTAEERPDDARRFDRLKHRLADGTWNETLAELFHLDLLEAGASTHA